MTDFTRLTVIGRQHKADLVVPHDELVGTLIPGLMQLLREPTGSAARPLTLVRSTGQQLDLHASLGDQQVLDGESLRLVRVDAAPPPPEVTDITDALAETHGARRGRWTSPARQVTASIGLGAFGAAAGLGLSELTREAETGAAAALSAVVGLAVIALGIGLAGSAWGARAVTAFAVGAAPAAGILVSTALGWQGGSAGHALIAGAVALGLIWITLGLGLGVGTRSRSARYGGAVGVALSAVPLIALAIGIPVLGAIAATALVAVVGCGLVPWFALSASGLTGLDDQIMEGRGRRRPDVMKTVDEAYRSLTWATAALALPLAGAATLLVVSGDPWAVGLGAAVVLITALRTRAFPLTVQVAALWVAAALPVVLATVGAIAVDALIGTIAIVALAVVTVLAAGAEPPAHQRARLRRLGNVLELLAVLSLIPVALGVFGVYSDLLGAF